MTNHPQPELPAMVDLYARLGGCGWGYTAEHMRAMFLQGYEAALSRPQDCSDGEIASMDAIVAAYNQWPRDIRRKLSLHDLRRMTGWAPPASAIPTAGQGGDCNCASGRGAEPAVWVAADTLNSPHPTCISSLAYMSQLDRERGREYVPLYTTPQPSAEAVKAFLAKWEWLILSRCREEFQKDLLSLLDGKGVGHG